MKARIFWIIIALQMSVILGITLQHEIGLATGQSVLLETEPVDPRDLLRGDYVILNYKISRLQGALAPESAPLSSQQGVYVLLEKRGDFHEAVRSSRARPTPGPGQVMIRGVLAEHWSGNAEYGLERYYVPEGTGNPSGKVTVRARVSSAGTAMIEEVYVNGVPYREAMRKR